MGQLQDWLKFAEAKAKELVNIPKALGLTNWGAAVDVSSGDIGSIDTSKLDEALSAADKGNFYNLGAMTLLMLERDASVSAHWGTRRNAVLSRDWEIVDSANPDSEDAQELRKAIDNEALRITLSTLADVPLIGFGGVFLEWDQENGAPAKAVPIHPTRLRFDYGGNPAIMLPDDGGKDVETAVSTMEPGRIVSARASHSTHPARSGLCRPLLWLHIFHRAGIETRALYMERFGMPFLHGKMTLDQYNNETVRKAFVANLKKAGRLNSMVSPEGVEVRFEAHTGAAANANHGEYISSFDEMISKLILGQTGTSGQGSGLSEGGAQTDVRMDIMASDARLISEAMTMQYVRPAAQFIGLSEPERFEFQIQVDPPEDLQSKATMIKTLSDAGYKAEKAWVSETFGLPLDETEPADPIQPIEANIPEKPKPENTEDIPMSDDPQPKANDIERLVARASAAVASQAFGTVEEMAAMYGPIRKAVSTAFADLDLTKEDWMDGGMERLKTLSDMLPEAVRQMDFSAFKDALRQAQNGAAAEGYTK